MKWKFNFKVPVIDDWTWRCTCIENLSAKMNAFGKKKRQVACASTSDHNLGSATFSLFWNLFRDWGGKSIYHLIHCTGTEKSLLFKLNTYGYLSMTCCWTCSNWILMDIFKQKKREYSLTVATGGEKKHSYNCKVILTDYIQAPYGLFGYLH